MELVALWLAFGSIFAHVDTTDKRVLEIAESKYNLDATMSDEGVYIRLPDSRFAVNSFRLDANQVIAVKSVSELLDLNGLNKRKAYVEGHTDKSGSDESNMKLSQKRADTVTELLIESGLSNDRVISVGYGSLYPLSDDPAENRRVQVLIYKPGK